MKKKLKGGIETIVAIIIVTGIVVALIFGVVLPTATEGEELMGAATSELTGLQTTIGPEGEVEGL